MEDFHWERKKTKPRRGKAKGRGKKGFPEQSRSDGGEGERAQEKKRQEGVGIATEPQIRERSGGEGKEIEGRKNSEALLLPTISLQSNVGGGREAGGITKWGGEKRDA